MLNKNKMTVFRAKRKKELNEFSAGDKIINSLLLLLLFFTGLYISLQMGVEAVVLHIVSWILSFVVIYAGACRYCAYYGKGCPVPLEGGLVHIFFKKKDSGFGITQLAWAGLTYALRVIIPTIAVIKLGLFVEGIIFYSIFILFNILHSLVVGCPNCINRDCPLNPDFGRR